MERTYDEEISKRINYLLRERTCMQMQRSESSEYVWNITLSTQTVGESE